MPDNERPRGRDLVMAGDQCRQISEASTPHYIPSPSSPMFQHAQEPRPRDDIFGKNVIRSRSRWVSNSLKFPSAPTAHRPEASVEPGSATRGFGTSIGTKGKGSSPNTEHPLPLHPPHRLGRESRQGLAGAVLHPERPFLLSQRDDLHQ